MTILNTPTEHSTYINGVWHKGLDENLVSSTPDGTEILWEKTTSANIQVTEAVASAYDAFQHWKNTTLDERKEVLHRYADALKEYQQELSSAIQLETGKPSWEADAEVQAMVNKISISIGAYHERTGEKTLDNTKLQHRPHGVMAVFGPFNFPGHLPNGHIVPALLAGNTCIFKPSEETPWVGELLIRIWEKCSPPNGVLNLVQGGHTVGEALLSSSIQGVLFTGSSATGKMIHSHFSGRPEIILALEMGGNNPFITGNIEDIDTAANIIMRSAFSSAGQRCTCTRRLILIENKKNLALLEKLISLCSSINLNTLNNQKNNVDIFMGPVINRSAAENVFQNQEHLITLGAMPLIRVSSEEEGEVHLRPGILDTTGVHHIPDEETFGPLLQVIRVNNFHQALVEANNTRFGLAAGLLSNDEKEQHYFLNEIRAGIVSINAPTAGASSKLPFGGVGESGNARPSAFYAADYCAWPQAITLGKNL